MTRFGLLRSVQATRHISEGEEVRTNFIFFHGKVLYTPSPFYYTFIHLSHPYNWSLRCDIIFQNWSQIPSGQISIWNSFRPLKFLSPVFCHVYQTFQISSSDPSQLQNGTFAKCPRLVQAGTSLDRKLICKT